MKLSLIKFEYEVKPLILLISVLLFQVFLKDEGYIKNGGFYSKTDSIYAALFVFDTERAIFTSVGLAIVKLTDFVLKHRSNIDVRSDYDLEP